LALQLSGGDPNVVKAERLGALDSCHRASGTGDVVDVGTLQAAGRGDGVHILRRTAAQRTPPALSAQTRVEQR